MRAKLAILNHCAELFLSRAAASLGWYYYMLQRAHPFGSLLQLF